MTTFEYGILWRSMPHADTGYGGSVTWSVLPRDAEDVVSLPQKTSSWDDVERLIRAEDVSDGHRKKIAELGRDGWELVTSDQIAGQQEMYFKRQAD